MSGTKESGAKASGPASGGPEAPQDSAPAPRMPGWARGLLFASLALNLLVLGVVGGEIVSRREHRATVWPRDAASAIYLRALPQEHRDAFEADLRGAAPALRPSRAEIRAELAATLAAIRAEAFEPEALMARIAAQRGRLAERVALGDRLFVERIASMSLAERRAFADRLEQGLRRGGRGREE